MKSFLTSLGGAAILALLPVSGHAVAAQPRAAMSVVITSVKPTTVTKKHAAVTFRLSVRGITLDARHMGKVNQAGHGHIQLYVDRIPTDAYTRKDLKHNWLASLAAPVFTLNLLPQVLGGPGKHRIIIALAQNNYVLYRTPTSAVTILAK